MKIYIRSTGIISPQDTFNQSEFLSQPLWYDSNRLRCVLPDYKALIDAKLIRRMSRIIKMGVAAALNCLQNGGEKMPDAIITGTAYGCLEDTENFLKRLIENNEDLLSPTAFIQSTHNTVAAQIALLLSCHSYNNTYVSRGFSFENALLDAQMLLLDNNFHNILVGGVDELTDDSYKILSRFGLYKSEQFNTSQLFKIHSKGTVAGEGASFFLLSNQKQENDSVCLEGFATLYKPESNDEVTDFIHSFLQSNTIDISNVDLVITGKNGDSKNDLLYNHLENNVFANSLTVNYKHLCGEYPTATSFALWLATNIIQTNSVPACLLQDDVDHANINVENVLIYNNYLNIHHSIYLLSAC